MENESQELYLASERNVSQREKSRKTVSRMISPVSSDAAADERNVAATRKEKTRSSHNNSQPPLWTQFHGYCKKCKEKVTNGEGLFCSNYYAKRGKFPPCLGIWCGGCYVATGKIENSFPVCWKKRQFSDDDDDEDFVIDFDGSRGAQEEKEATIYHHDVKKRRFMYGRVGDHLMVHFQCDLCHFRNIRHRDPATASKISSKHKNTTTATIHDEDERLLMCIRRANLDAFWARETSTVLANFWEGVRFMENANKLGGLDSRSSTFPALGPHSVEDTCGMFTAACILMSTLNLNNATDMSSCDMNLSGSSKYSTNMGSTASASLQQYDASRKMNAFYSSFWHASIASEERAEMVTKHGEMTMSGNNNICNNNNMFVSSCPIDGPWYEQFNRGMQKRIGCRKHHRPKLNISIEVMLELMKMYENEWEEYGGDSLLWLAESADILFPALFSVLSFCGAMRGDETCLMDLAGTRNNFKAGMNDPPTPNLRHVTVALYCTFKYQICEMYHLLPIAATTASGLQPALWVDRMLRWYHVRGIRNGPVFRNHATGQGAKRQDFEWNVLSHLSLIQIERPDIIPRSVDIFEGGDSPEMNSIFRRGSQLHAAKTQRATIRREDIDLNNQWRKFKKNLPVTGAGPNKDAQAEEKREGEETGSEQRQRHHKPQLQIHQLYTEVLQHLPALLKYSSGL